MPETIFIDAKSKRKFTTEDLKQPWTHLSDAFWVPALGTRDYPDFDGHTYISGATKSGKSYLIRKMVDNDAKKRMCVLFTDLETNDPAFENMEYVKYSTKYENLPEEEIPTGFRSATWLKENQRDKILIFDDVQYNKKVILYRDYMLEKGRHLNCVVVCVNHKTQDYQKTKVPLNECQYVVTFPCSNRGACFRYLKREFEMNKNLIEFVLETACKEGRHLICYRFNPMCIATTESVFKV